MTCLVLAMSGTSALLGWIDRHSQLADPRSGLADATPTAQALSVRQAGFANQQADFAKQQTGYARAEGFANSTLLTAKPNRTISKLASPDNKPTLPTSKPALPVRLHED